MSNPFKVFVVDDDQTTGFMVESMLDAIADVAYFSSAADCLASLDTGFPDIFLLDVDMPGMDGYELCRRIKARPESKQVPVIFLSGHDRLEDVLAGYDAGAEDYVTKPFEHIGLQRKIDNLLRIVRDRAEADAKALAAEEMAEIFSDSLNDNAILIRYLRSLNECVAYKDIVDSTITVLGAYRLHGALQIRMRHLEETFSSDGENWPMEIAVINNVRGMGDIFEFKSRAVFNFGHLSILITDMPIEDAELCGRIRDTLAIVAESANAKLVALQSVEDNQLLRAEISELLAGLGQTIETYGQRYDEARYQGSLHTANLVDRLLAMLAHISLSEKEEDAIVGLVKSDSEKLIDLFDFASQTGISLAGLRVRMESLLQGTAEIPSR